MIEPHATTVLVIGFGNPAREDDALGPAAAAKVEALCIDGVTVDSDYQLTVEDAASVAAHDTVVFIDATVEGDKPYSFTRIVPKVSGSLSSHSVAPEEVIALAEELFCVTPNAYILGIRGYSFAMFTETMTGEAECNLDEALKFLEPMLRSRTFDQMVERT